MDRSILDKNARRARCVDMHTTDIAYSYSTAYDTKGKMIVRIYTAYGGKTPTPTEVRQCAIPELGAELMSIYLLHGSTPLYVLFKKGERHSECVVIIGKAERRKGVN